MDEERRQDDPTAEAAEAAVIPIEPRMQEVAAALGEEPTEFAGELRETVERLEAQEQDEG